MATRRPSAGAARSATAKTAPKAATKPVSKTAARSPGKLAAKTPAKAPRKGATRVLDAAERSGPTRAPATRSKAAKPAASGAKRTATTARAASAAKPAAARKTTATGAKAAAGRARPAAKAAPKRAASAPRKATATVAAPRPAAAPKRVRKAELSVAQKLRQVVIGALDSMKAKDVKEIDVRDRSSVTDLLVIASGTSTRHVKSMADEVVTQAKRNGFMPMGVEGEKEAEWVLVDLGDLVVHLMLPRTREFYDLERLWSVTAESRAQNSG